ncbi:MAG: dCMP deaminase family protein [Planctomycetota bacterium]|nr:dCMP deaminase family protein [Planctomycetota bacterium]
MRKAQAVAGFRQAIDRYTSRMDTKWDNRFLDLAGRIALWSKDPSRGVGCIIVTPDRRICSTGFNGLPAGIEDLPERLVRPTKYDLICHAEQNAVIQCARNGISPEGCTLYATFFPCISCALTIVQAGITRVVSWGLAPGDEHWMESIEKSMAVFKEAGVSYELCARPENPVAETIHE